MTFGAKLRDVDDEEDTCRPIHFIALTNSSIVGPTSVMPGGHQEVKVGSQNGKIMRSFINIRLFSSP